MDYELIWWCVAGVLALYILIKVATAKDDHIEMTWGEKRDVERWEKKWK